MHSSGLPSRDGASRCGIFCAVHICCDQLRNDGEVDVFNAVRLVRHNRPQLVTSLDEYRYIYSFMADYVRTMASQGPQIVITGAEEDNHHHPDMPLHPAPGPGPLQSPDGLSTDDSLSCISSQAGSFETALDDVVDCVLPDNPEVQATLTACIAQLSPHLSHRILMSDRCRFPSTLSLSSLQCQHHDQHLHHLHHQHHRHHRHVLNSVGFMAASVANVFTPECLKQQPASLVLNGLSNRHHSRLSDDREVVFERSSSDGAFNRVTESFCYTSERNYNSERCHYDDKFNKFCESGSCQNNDEAVKGVTAPKDTSFNIGRDAEQSHHEHWVQCCDDTSQDGNASEQARGADLVCNGVRHTQCHCSGRVHSADICNNNIHSKFPCHDAGSTTFVNVNHCDDIAVSLTADCGRSCARRRWLRRRNTSESFHSVGSSFNLAQT